jgi:hypothetical protein
MLGPAAGFVRVAVAVAVYIELFVQPAKLRGCFLRAARQAAQRSGSCDRWPLD